ncbi:MAG: hypothetical protein WA139_05895 [Candidatus Aenigmatarchaeota archaeon]
MKFNTIIYFLIILLFTLPYPAISQQKINFDINFDDRNHPIILLQEMDINGDTVHVKNTYTLRAALPNFTCTQTMTSPRETNFWDYKVFVNGSLDYEKLYLETKIIEENNTNNRYWTTLPCRIYNSTSTIVQEYFAAL